jgi:tetratricopeptide (TPR) repeat protein
MRRNICFGVLTACLVVITVSPGLAQHCSPNWTAEYRCMQGCGGCPTNPGYDNGAAQRAAAEAAAAKAQNHLAIDAADRGDWALAEIEFRKCLQYWPHDPVILNAIANAEQLEGVAAYQRGDYDAALEFYRQSMVNEPPTDQYYQTMLDNYNATKRNVDAIRTRQAQQAEAIRTKQAQERQDAQTSLHIDQSIQSFTQSLSTTTQAPDELDFSDGKHPKRDGKTLTQARVSAASNRSADCVFDGTKGCGVPVALVTVSAGSPPVPPEAAKYIESIPKSVRQRPAVKANIALYEHMASVRGELQNQMIADAAAAKAHPDDESKKLKVMEDSGHLKAAKDDENKAKERVGFSIGLLKQPSGAPSK